MRESPSPALSRSGNKGQNLVEDISLHVYDIYFHFQVIPKEAIRKDLFTFDGVVNLDDPDVDGAVLLGFVVHGALVAAFLPAFDAENPPLLEPYSAEKILGLLLPPPAAELDATDWLCNLGGGMTIWSSSSS